MSCICGVIGIGAQHSGACMLHNRWESARDEKLQSELQDAHQQIERLTRELDEARAVRMGGSINVLEDRITVAEWAHRAIRAEARVAALEGMSDPASQRCPTCKRDFGLHYDRCPTAIRVQTLEARVAVLREALQTIGDEAEQRSTWWSANIARRVLAREG